jgi:predicted RNA-binding Zn-ribbon protein involved in translation (DUF1610 family)
MSRKLYRCSNLSCNWVGEDWIYANVPVVYTTSSKKSVVLFSAIMSYRCPACGGKLIEEKTLDVKDLLNIA